MYVVGKVARVASGVPSRSHGLAGSLLPPGWGGGRGGMGRGREVDVRDGGKTSEGGEPTGPSPWRPLVRP